MNDMKRLLSYAGPYKRDMIFGAVLVLVETCFELFIPILISNLIDIGVANFTAVGGAGNGIYLLGTLFFHDFRKDS